MRFKNTDSTFGSGSLVKIGQTYYDSLTSDKKFLYFELMEEFKSTINDSWLLALLCQYDSRKTYELGDMIWFGHIKEMINRGSLYMALFYVDNWAFADIEFNKNSKNIENVGISITTENKKNSDGIWFMEKELELHRIYQSDKETPSNPEKIKIDNPFGVAEFGTQKICKSAVTLLMNDMLLRVPYKPIFEYDNPVCAIFYNDFINTIP